MRRQTKERLRPTLSRAPNLYMCPSQSTHHTQSFYTWMPLWKEQKKSKGAHLHIEASAHSHYACEKSNIWPFVYEIRNDNRLFTTGGIKKYIQTHFCICVPSWAFPLFSRNTSGFFGFRFDTMYSMKDVMWTEERTRLWFLVSRSPGREGWRGNENRKRKPFHIWDWSLLIAFYCILMMMMMMIYKGIRVSVHKYQTKIHQDYMN